MKHDVLVRAITEITNRLPYSRYIWALTGGASMQLQGLSHDAQDIDILASPQFSEAASRELSPQVVFPLQRTRMQNIESLYSRFIMEGVSVDVMVDVSNRGSDGIWRFHTEWVNHICQYHLGSINIPVLSLSYEMEISTMLGLEKKIKMLLEFDR